MDIEKQLMEEIAKELESEMKDMLSPDNTDDFDQIESKILGIRHRFEKMLAEKILATKSQNNSQKKTVVNAEGS